MPASTFADPVNAALRSAFRGGRSDKPLLDTQLAGAAKKALLTEVRVEPAGDFQSTVLGDLKSKYIVLKAADRPKTTSKPEATMGADETLKLAKYELYPSNAVQLGWNKCDWTVGAGMVNMGNTCYLNSTLQALFHVPALVNWLISDKEHSANCHESGGLCIICAMRKTLQDSQQRNAATIRPMLIYTKLRLFCRNLLPGRQEDAHEFLRCLMEAMEKAYLSRFKNHSDMDPKVQETTPLNQIFGGYLRSAVRCLKCGHVSTTFQHFQDLLLDIRKAQTLDDALEGCFSKEKLDDDSYHCQSCQKKVPATKQFSVEKAPMVLCIQLKRFSVSNNKITKHIQFRQRLDLTRYARHRPTVPLVYRLVALVTHMGPTVNCGHYTAVAQSPTGTFYQFDDSMVRVISHQTVFSTGAYIMMYELETSPFAPLHKPGSQPNTNNNRVILCKPATPNGVGFTSEKAYGPELPPDRLASPAKDKTNNGIAVATNAGTNGNGKFGESPSSTSDSDSDPEKKENVVHTTPKKPQFTISTNSNRNNNFNHKNNGNAERVVSNATNPISTNEAKQKSAAVSTPTAKLVPYEMDDSNGSEEAEFRLSTKAAGEWKVTPTENINATNGHGASRNWAVPERKQISFNSSSTSSTVVTELHKMSHSGYAAPVSSWNGTRAHLDKEVAQERREDRKRALSDNSDQGRAKHIKLGNGYNNNKSNPGYNPVQEFHNAKNWNNGRHRQFYNTNNRHRRNFYQKSFRNNNYRFRQ